MARIGMLHPVFSPITAESENDITYGAGVVLGRAVEGALNWQRADDQLYGDDAVAETDNSISGYTLDVTATEMTEDVEQVVLGTIKNDSDEYEETNEPGPYGGAGYVQVLKRFGKLIYRAIWYYKICFGIQSEQTQTKGQAVTWGTPTVHGLGMAVYNDQSGKAKFRKKKKFNNAADAIAYLDGLGHVSGSGQRGLVLNTTALSLTAGSTSTLTPTSTPSGATSSNVSWYSADTAVATVSTQGLVTAVSAGTTLVSASYNGDTATCRVTVTGA